MGMSLIFNKRTSLTKKLFYICYILFFIVPLASQLISSVFSYIFDLLILLMILTCCIEYKRKVGLYKFLWPILLYLLIALFSSVLNGVSIQLFVWAFRNSFRGYFLLYISYIILHEEDIIILRRSTYTIAYINFLVCLIEMAFGYNWDYLGGLFGIEKGGNGYLTLFLAAICGFALNDYLSGEIKLSKLVLILGTSFIEAAIGEMKFCLLLIIAIAFLALLINGGLKKIKNCIIFVIISVLAYFGLVLLSILFEDSNMLTIDFFLHYLEVSDRGYNSIGDVNRTTFITVLNDFFDFSPIEKLLGIGFGAAEISNLSIFQSRIGDSYADLLHYNWFQSSFVYLETGILGLVFTLLSFVYLFFVSFKCRHQSKIFKDGIILSIVAIVFVFYNCVLRNSFGLFYYIFLSFSLIKKRELCVSRVVNKSREVPFAVLMK